MGNIIKRVEEGTTTVHDAKELKEKVIGIILISLGVGIAIGALLMLW